MQTLAQNQQLTVKQIAANNKQLKTNPKELEKKRNLSLTYLRDRNNYYKGESDDAEEMVLRLYGCL